jgi:hypothetical protein
MLVSGSKLRKSYRRDDTVDGGFNIRPDFAEQFVRPACRSVLSAPEEIERAIQNGQDIADCQILRLSNKLVPPPLGPRTLRIIPDFRSWFSNWTR